jgi:hypothetical protein
MKKKQDKIEPLLVDSPFDARIHKAKIMHLGPQNWKNCQDLRNCVQFRNHFL